MTSLVLRDVALMRGGLSLARRVSRTIPAGGALWLRGPNGAGKSSLLRVLAGLVAPEAGSIMLAERPLAETAPTDRLYVAHHNALKLPLSVRANLTFWTSWHRPELAALARGATVEEALAAVGLLAVAEQRAGSLSAGQARRLNLARLQTCPARLWLLDEPSGGLDTAGVALLNGWIARHRAQGGIIVAAAHQGGEGSADGSISLHLPEAQILELPCP